MAENFSLCGKTIKLYLNWEFLSYTACANGWYELFNFCYYKLCCCYEHVPQNTTYSQVWFLIALTIHFIRNTILLLGWVSPLLSEPFALRTSSHVLMTWISQGVGNIPVIFRSLLTEYNCCKFVSAIFMLWIPHILQHPDLGSPLKYTELIFIFMEPVWDDFVTCGI